MKKITIIAIAIAFLASCMPQEKTAEQLTLEISKTKGQISELNSKVQDLEKQLAELQTAESHSGIKVTASFVAPETFESFIKTSAIVEAVQAAMISPEANGKILKLHVKEGQKVNKGQLLVTLDSEMMEKSLAEMEKSLELIKTMFDKQQELYDAGVGSELQYLQAKNQYESMVKSRETLKTQLEMSKINAPFSGYVESIFQKAGELASPGRQIIELINLDKLYINTDLSENYLSRVSKGDSVWISFPHLPEIEKVVKISQVGKSIDAMSRTFSVRVDMDNKGEQLKPNMMATLKLRDYYNPEAIVIPTTLIRQDPKGSFVYVARQHDGNSHAVKMYVETGRSNGVKTIINSGLKAGDMLITEGYNLIKDGNTLQVNTK